MDHEVQVEEGMEVLDEGQVATGELTACCQAGAQNARS